jgi:hypothetical protein
LARAHEDAVYDLLIKGKANLVDAARYRRMDETIAHQVQEIIGLPVTRSGRHGWSKSLLVVPLGQPPVGQRNQLSRTRFQFYAGVEDQVEVVEGRFPRPATDPQDVVEVMVTETLAEELGLKVGDVFHVEDFTGSAQPMQVQIRLAAIIRLRDPESAFWFYAPWFLDEAFTVPEETFFNSILLTFVPAGAEFTWGAPRCRRCAASTCACRPVSLSPSGGALGPARPRCSTSSVASIGPIVAPSCSAVAISPTCPSENWSR